MRRKDREVTNMDEIMRIVEQAKILHLALFDSEYPYVLPLHYGYELKEGSLVFYLHSAKEGHKYEKTAWQDERGFYDRIALLV